MSCFSLQKQNVRIKKIIFNHALSIFENISFFNCTHVCNSPKNWAAFYRRPYKLRKRNTNESLLNHKLVNVSIYNFIKYDRIKIYCKWIVLYYLFHETKNIVNFLCKMQSGEPVHNKVQVLQSIPRKKFQIFLNIVCAVTCNQKLSS